ncbi:L,D-transpeptidase family protein [Flammeovirga sp. SubArs3]|uniref:L,D-transpeptidase family protein n=1 Tax=Flammeovirga sp. SubArs3 TaxID=2995316 RepID=UPI00248B5A25|nr:L,D-transpeptidase family protein [Flammeovirga sp. SubArs3]
MSLSLSILHSRNFLIYICALFFSAIQLNAQNASKDDIQRVLSTVSDPNAEYTFFSDSLMPLIYERVDYDYIWKSSTSIDGLIYSIHDAYNDGLTPEHYHLEHIETLLNKKNEGSITSLEAATLDILMTDAGILLSSHYLWGKVQPETISTTWNYDTQEIDGDKIELFLEPIQAGLVKEAISTLKPKDVLYTGLKATLAQLREIKESGGWSKLPKMESIEVGDQNEYIPELRKRLAVTGNLITFDTTILKVDSVYRSHSEGVVVNDAPSIHPKVDTVKSFIPYSPIPVLDSSMVTVQFLDTTSTIFDDNLRRSVIKFQEMYGLETDGKVGKATLKQLNIPIKDRINTLRVNLERTRWINPEDKDNFIFVNIPSYALFLHKNGRWFYQTKVITGKPYHQTPVFKSKLSYIDINPTWTVPYSIASKEMLPKLKKDASYLGKHNMTLYDRSNNIIDPTTVDWKPIKQTNFPYFIVQGSGPRNALGHVKFIFPNKYSIYLHDTPSRYLFSKNTRAFSHGCIRVYQPVKLASILINDPNYTEQKIEEIIKEGELKRVYIQDRPTVYLMYFTAILGPEDAIHFYDDIYSRDKRVLKQLDKKPY